MSTTWALFATCAVLVSSYIFLAWHKQKNYFKRLGIKPGPTPLPILGNMLDILSKGVATHDFELIRDYGKIVGYFEGNIPVVMCSDTQFLKNVMIKDFNYFRNRRSYGDWEPFKSFLIALNDDEWKAVRSIVTPTFSSGKLKAMMKTLKPCVHVIIEHCEKLAEHDEYFDTKKIFGSYTLDSISSCCFGMRADVLNDPENQIILSFNKIFSIQTSPKFIFLLLFPKFAHFFQRLGLVDFVAQDSFTYLRNVTEEIINRRKSKLEFRNDFIQTMADYNEKENQCIEPDLKTNFKKTSLTNNEVLAQAVLFILAGYETTTTTLGYIAYNLAVYQECQKKLIEEIDECLKKHGEINYEMINDLPYLDMIINETLRLYPPGARTDRIASEDYEYDGMKIPKGTAINISIWSLHHDPEIYPEPEKFIPERFNDENKSKRENEEFIPFGTGPRFCIGMRFALMEMKLLICEILTRFMFVKSDKTPMKITIDKSASGFSKSKEPVIIKLEKRFQTKTF